jgi:hypothetical protein
MLPYARHLRASRRAVASVIFLRAAALMAQNPRYPGVRPFVAVDAPLIALEHVRVIDGTGAAAREDQAIVIAEGKIRPVGPASEVPIPAGVQRVDLTNQTVIPGLVGMHEHLFYSGAGVAIYTEHGFRGSVSRVYIWRVALPRRARREPWNRTPTSTSEIDRCGPHAGTQVLITAGYLEGKGMFTPQMTEVDTPEDARPLSSTGRRRAHTRSKPI